MIKKLIFLLFLFFLSYNFSFSYTIKGAISFTVDTARNIAFTNVEKKIDMSKYNEYFIDRNHESNLKALKKRKSNYKGMKLTLFSDGTYSIRYKIDPKVTYYYDANGVLSAIGLNEEGDYPLKSIKYKRTGELQGIALYISGKEQFVFDAMGKFNGHWFGQYSYDINGEIDGYRH